MEAASGMENLRSSSAMHRFTAILITLLLAVPASRQYSKARLFLNLGLRPPRLGFRPDCEVRRKQPGYLTSHSTWEKMLLETGLFGMSRNTIKCGATAKSV